jgi:Fe2+ transport system protein FeoA
MRKQGSPCPCFLIQPVFTKYQILKSLLLEKSVRGAYFNINTKKVLKMNNTLAAMQPGQCGKIISVSRNLRSYKKFADLGIVKGSLIELERIAPLGDPLEVRIKGYNLSLRKEEAANIKVEIDNDASCA